jgi:hypothetical protein
MTCLVCRSSPCFLICPTQDPYAGRPWDEHCDHEANAPYDSVMERFAGEGDFFDYPEEEEESGEVNPVALREIQALAEAERAKKAAAPPLEDDDILF